MSQHEIYLLVSKHLSHQPDKDELVVLEYWKKVHSEESVIFKNICLGTKNSRSFNLYYGTFGLKWAVRTQPTAFAPRFVSPQTETVP